MRRLLLIASHIEFVVLITVLLILALGVPEVLANSVKPLPILGNNGQEIGLYKRILSRPGAIVTTAPTSTTVVETPPPFSTFYVFDEKNTGSSKYFQVGPNVSTPPTGWIPKDGAIDWPNNLTLAFNEPTVRDRVLFFETIASASLLVSDDAEMNRRSEALLNKAKERKLAPYDGVMAIESDDFVHWSDRFYIMPVLDFVVQTTPETSSGKKKYNRKTLVKTAAIPVADTSKDSLSKTCGEPQKAAIVFVIDTTLSMQPYIDRTLRMVEKIIKTIVDAGLEDRVSFGLVGFRDKPAHGADVDYPFKVFQQLNPKDSPKKFLSVLAKLTAAKQSTEGFGEDGLRGILAAANMDWSPYGSGWIVYISDASMRTPILDNDGKKRSIESIGRELWETKQVAIASFHLQTPEAKRAENIKIAQEQLEKLKVGASKSLPYFGILNGDIGTFGVDIDRRVDQIIRELKMETAQLAGSSHSGDPISEIGYAQRLIWLGKCEDNKPPSVAEGWIADSAIGAKVNRSRNLRAFEPRILLARKEMDQLAEALAAVREAADKGSGGPGAFFNRIGGLLGLSISDPGLVSTIGKGGKRSKSVAKKYDVLGDFLPSFLLRTPYQSDFLTITQADWVGTSAIARRDWKDKIDVAISTLRIYFNKPESELYKLHPSAAPSEWVYPILLSDLP